MWISYGDFIRSLGRQVQRRDFLTHQNEDDEMVTPRLPPELIYYIIDHLHDDTKALRQCSLTHRSWVLESQYHLFGHVRASCSSYRSLGRFVERNPLLAKPIRRLTIVCPGHQRSSWAINPLGGGSKRAGSYHKGCPLLSSDCPRLHTPNLQHLLLSGVMLTDASFAALPSPLGSVTTLDIAQCTFAVPDFRTFLSARLPALQHLNYSNNTVLLRARAPIADPNEAPAQRLSVHALHLTSPHSHHFWCIAPTLVEFAHIDTLVLTFVSRRADLATLQNVIWTLKHKLVRLEITLGSADSKEARSTFDCPFTLDVLPRVRSLKLDVRPMRWFHFADALLRSLSPGSAPLEELELAFGSQDKHSEAAYLQAVNLNALAQTLARQQFRELRRVVWRSMTDEALPERVQLRRDALAVEKLDSVLAKRDVALTVVVGR